MDNTRIAGAVALLLVIIFFIIVALHPPSVSNNPTTSTIVTTSVPTFQFVLSPSKLTTFNYFNGSRQSVNFTSNINFLNLNTTTSPLTVIQQGSVLIPLDNLSAAAKKSLPAAFIENPYIAPTPMFSKNGLMNSTSLVLYAGKRVGSGDNVVKLYAKTGNWSVYSNGTKYYVENGTFSVYLFAFGNTSGISSIVPYGQSVNQSVAAQGTQAFPSQFMTALNSLLSNNGISFVSNGKWWYYGYYSGQFVPVALPKGFQKMS